MKLIAVFALLIASSAVAHAEVAEPTDVMARYYCVAGEQPASGNYFLAGHVDISAQPFELWCEAVY